MNPGGYDLTEGSLRAMLNGVVVDRPTVQLVDTHELKNNNPGVGKRYRLLLNDGRNTYNFAMLGTQLNSRFEAQEFSPFSIITLEKYVCSEQGPPNGEKKKVLIILQVRVDVPGDQVNQKIGNPTPMGENVTAAGSANQSSAQRQPQQPAVNRGAQQQQPFHNPPRAQMNGGQQQNSFGGGGNNNGFRPQQNNGSNNSNNNNQNNFGNRQQGFGESPAKRPNLGSGGMANNNNQNPRMPSANQGQFRPQTPSYPPSGGGGGGFSGGNGGMFGGGGNQSSFGGGNQSTFGGGADDEGFGEGQTPQNIFPLTSLTPYQNKWTIRVRVQSKDPIRTYVNQKGEGKVFGMIIADESDDMKCTGFNSEVDRFYDMFEVNKVYFIRNAGVKTINDQRYSRGKQYEMSLRSDTMVKECLDDVPLPTIHYNFTQIDRMQDAVPESTVDVIGICGFVGDIQNITSSKTKRDLTKRDIELRDVSNFSVRMTLWSAQAEQFDADTSMNNVIAVKGAIVKDFGGRTLSTLSSSSIQINPDIPEAHLLRGWFDQSGRTMAPQSISMAAGAGGGGSTPWKNLLQIQTERLGNGDKPDYFMLKGSIMKIRNKDNALYMACPEDGCNKKVIDQGNQTYRCEKCNKDQFGFKWRLMLQAEVADFGGGCYPTIFHEQAEQILGKSAQELGDMRSSDMTSFDKIIADSQFKSFIFKARVKMENYNDENRLKYQVMAVDPINVMEYSTRLLTMLKELNIQ